MEDYQVTILPSAAAGRAFSVQNTISIDIDMDEARSVFAADLDDDGDMDLLSASRLDDTIAWYENNGSESFTKHTISTTAALATSVFAADVDGDLMFQFHDDQYGPSLFEGIVEYVPSVSSKVERPKLVTPNPADQTPFSSPR